MKLVSSFGERLKEAMTLRGVRAVDISNNTNISKPLLSNYIRGRYKPKQEAIMKIAKYLKVSEVDLDYTVQIRTTTNIPVSYELYANDDTTNIIGTKQIVQDSNGMYFFNYSPQVGSFTHSVQKTESFTLVINFPSIYNDAAYQDLIETVEVTVDANQV